MKADIENVFFHPCISATCLLSEEESNHAIRVFRLSNGDKIKLVDGKGGLYEGVITDANPKKCSVSIPGFLPGKEIRKTKGFCIHMAVAPTKSPNRFEWFLEKATEIGVDEITPLICGHSEKRLSVLQEGRKEKKNGRMEKILVSALKQSMNLFLPKLNPPENFNDFVLKAHPGKKFIAHYSESHLKNLYKKGEDALVLIGPEGDFTESEIGLAGKNGFLEVSLGKSRLRTETAALVACHTVNLINES